VAVSASERARVVSLLDADPEIDDALPAAQRRDARQRALVAVWRLDVGAWRPPPAEALAHPPVGLLVLDGVVIRDTTVGSRTAAQLLGPGEIITPWTDAASMLDRLTRWTVVEPVQTALIDERLLTAVRPWPQIAATLLDRIARQEARLSLVHAICQLSRVEDRITSLLWLLADRWGRVGRDGVIVPLRLTHALLGDVVGAARPTVTLALHALEREKLVVRREDGSWLLSPDGRPALVVPEGGTSRRQPARAPGHVRRLEPAIAAPQEDDDLDALRRRARKAMVTSHAAVEASTRLCRQLEETRRRHVSGRAPIRP
jgi:CRP/FNR family transcriptional regulator, cyclic AMP receptor protein